MSNEEIIRNARSLAKKHENDTVFTFGVDYNRAFTDIANHIEQQAKENAELRAENIQIKAYAHAEEVKADFHTYCELVETNDDLAEKNRALKNERDSLHKKLFYANEQIEDMEKKAKSIQELPERRERSVDGIAYFQFASFWFWVVAWSVLVALSITDLYF